VDRRFSLIGVKDRIGITTAPLLVDVSQKVLWYFWGDPEKLTGSLKIMGTSKNSGEAITLFEGKLGKGNSVLGSTTSMPSGIKLTDAGLWRLDVYINGKLFESLIVQGNSSH
jgi:hypothetical protein